jgi:Protein of unknown function (DUF2491)
MPLRLSQDSAVTLSMVPVVLAEAAGSLIKSDMPSDHKIVADGEMSVFGIQYLRAYLSNGDGAFIQFAMRGDKVAETRFYKPYAEVIPVSSDDWAFWIGQENGYIGAPMVQSKEEDGLLPYYRTWSQSDRRIDPIIAVEHILDAAGTRSSLRHSMMHYARTLAAAPNQSLAEYLLVSVVETPSGASVNFWLGMDIAEADLTVFPAADAPS